MCKLGYWSCNARIPVFLHRTLPSSVDRNRKLGLLSQVFDVVQSRQGQLHSKELHILVYEEALQNEAAVVHSDLEAALAAGQTSCHE